MHFILLFLVLYLYMYSSFSFSPSLLLTDMDIVIVCFETHVYSSPSSSRVLILSLFYVLTGGGSL